MWPEKKRDCGLGETEELASATVFIVLSPENPGDCIGTVANMVGGVLCTPSFLCEWARRGMETLTSTGSVLVDIDIIRAVSGETPRNAQADVKDL